MNSQIRKKLVSLMLSISLICQVSTPIAYANQPENTVSNETPTEIVFSGLKQSVTTGAAITIEPKIQIGSTIYNNAGEITGHLYLDSSTPTEPTYYSAGSGYLLFVPANGTEPTSITFHKLDLDSSKAIVFPSIPINLILEETNNIDTLYISNPVNITGGGILNLTTCYNLDSTNNNYITVTEGTQFNARYCLNAIDSINIYTIYGNFSLDYSMRLFQNNKLNLMPNATLNITNTGHLNLDKDSSANNIILNQGSSIVNNGIITLPKGSTVEQIKALSLTGTGKVHIVDTYDNDTPVSWAEYTNDGQKIDSNTNSIILGTIEITEAANLGYTWTKSENNGQEVWILNLNNTIIDRGITFPDKEIIINTQSESTIDGQIDSNFGNLTFTGSSKLNVFDRIYANDIIVKNNTILKISSKNSVQSITASNLNIIENSTVNIKASFGPDIYSGNLNIDDSSKLITDTTETPFLIRNFSGSKLQNEVISLPGLPAGTKLASIKGPSGTVYWTLAPENGNLSIVISPSGYEQVQGYATGKLIFEKKSNSGGSSSGGSSGGSSSSSKNTTNVPTAPVIPTKTPEELKKSATAPKPAIDSKVFTDITNHWAKADIAFVTQRGLFGGTSKDKFSPNMPMTRGMFVTVLGRLANADVSSSTDSKFKDVKKDAYYASYVDWANKNNIISGTAADKFSPNEPITKSQMEAIIANYSRFAGVNPPKLQSDTNGIATRAEVSAVLRRYIEFLEGLKI